MRRQCFYGFDSFSWVGRTIPNLLWFAQNLKLSMYLARAACSASIDGLSQLPELGALRVCVFDMRCSRLNPAGDCAVLHVALVRA